MDFDIMLDAAKWLGKSEDVDKIKALKKLYEENHYALTVWGHFSSGKSYLINNIIGRNILPVRKTETTAVLSYIMYGTEEQCRIIWTDGTVKRYNIGKTKEICQEGYLEEELELIDHIEVEVNCELLKEGLTIVDTPGINTLIERHQNLAFRAVEQSGQIFYVLGSSPSNVDKNFIQKIIDCGIKITFIRTNCDRFNSEEENPGETLVKEKEILKEFIGEEPFVIPVSNLTSSGWYENIDNVREIIKALSADLARQCQNSVRARLVVIAERYLSELKTEKERLLQIEKGNIKDIEKEIEECRQRIEELENISADKEKRVREKVEDTGKKIKRSVQRFVEERKENFKSRLDKVQFGERIEDVIKEIYQEHLDTSIMWIENLYNEGFSELIHEEDIQIDISSDFVAAPSYREVCDINSDTLKQYHLWLQETSAELEDVIKNRQDTEEILKRQSDINSELDYESLMQELERHLSEIPTNMALRVSENQNLQPSTILKHIGEAADLALLLMPGDAIVAGIKGVVNTTKLAQTLSKTGKIGKVIVDSVNVVGKSANGIDKVRDITYAANAIWGKRGYSTEKQKKQAKKLVDEVARKAGSAYDSFKEQKKSGNILDALSVAYWTEKIGEKFDTPPKFEIDVEEQEARNQLRKEITEKQNQISEERIRQRRELGLLADKAKELTLQEQEKKEMLKRIQDEYDKKEKEVVLKSQRKALETFKKSYMKNYEDRLINLAERISDQYIESARDNIAMYLAIKNNDLMVELGNKKQHLEQLLYNNTNNRVALQEKIDRCLQFISAMEGMI